MKKLRKLVVLLLAVTMLMSLGVVAAADTASITISDTVSDYGYKAYKVLDLTYDSATQSYAYTVPSEWVGFFWDSTAGGGSGGTASAVSSYVTVTKVSDTYYVTWTGSDTSTSAMQTFGNLIGTYITSETITATDTATANGNSVTFNNLSLGYYYVTSSLGSLIGLTSNETNVTIVDKNDKPTIAKSVAAGDSTTPTTWNEGYTTADLADTIYFRVVITGIDEINKLTLHDALPDGYSYSAITSVKLYSSSSDNDPRSLTATTDYELDTTVSSCTGSLTTCDFEIKFDNLLAQTASGSAYYDKVLSLTSNKDQAYIEVIYTVTVDSNKVSISNTSTATANTNTATITSSTNHVKSDTASVYYYDLYIYKYSGTDVSSGTALAGAVFTLSDGSGNYAKFDSSGYLTGWTTDSTESECSITTGSDGFIHIYGLDVGSYTLTETKAPDGYALPAVVTTSITISADGSTHVESVTNSTEVYNTSAGGNVKAVTVQNSKSSAMPTTGGIGTTIFYIIGGILVVGAVILIITRKRMRIDEA